MDSIPVSYITGDQAVNSLARMIEDAKARNSAVSGRSFSLADVVMEWAHEQEKRSYFEQRDYNAGSFSVSADPQLTPKRNENRVTLEAVKLGLSSRIPDEVLGGKIEIDRVAYETTCNIIARYRAYVWAEPESIQRQTVEYPADWWQAFKLRFMDKWPKWLRRRISPVEYTTVTLDVKAIYPTFKPKMPGYSSRLIVERVEL